MVEATEENVALATTAATLPVGWLLEKDGKPVSPWAELGAKAWPKDMKWKSAVDRVCVKSGRPALRVPAEPGLTLKVDQVLTEKRDGYRNPYGDGKFRITLANTTGGPVIVPALLSNNGKDILWDDSLVVMQSGKPCLFPGAGSLTADARPFELAANQRVNIEVDTLKLKGVNWPRGGSGSTRKSTTSTANARAPAASGLISKRSSRASAPSSTRPPANASKPKAPWGSSTSRSPSCSARSR